MIFNSFKNWYSFQNHGVNFTRLGLTIISCSVQTVRCCVIMFQIDYENKWFDAIPRITYTDKSTYVESQTKTYDQVLNYKVLLHVINPCILLSF